MKTLFNDGDRAAILARIGRVTDASAPLWGQFTADRMLCHLVESMKMASGGLPVRPKKLPLRLFPLKQIAIYLAPFPKGVPTAPELLAAPETAVDVAQLQLRAAIDRFAERSGATSWPDHPAFGRMSRGAWGVLTYRHCDHHLRQFGV